MTKYCTDCKFHIRRWSFWPFEKESVCGRYHSRVDGSPILNDCTLERHPEGNCGVDGSGFAPLANGGLK